MVFPKKLKEANISVPTLKLCHYASVNENQIKQNVKIFLRALQKRIPSNH